MLPDICLLYTSNRVPGVRIPLSPPKEKKSKGKFICSCFFLAAKTRQGITCCNRSDCEVRSPVGDDYPLANFVCLPLFKGQNTSPLRQRNPGRLHSRRIVSRRVYGFISVSYTHLDVYKRQGIARLSRDSKNTLIR